jgi:hypothetical protein
MSRKSLNLYSLLPQYLRTKDADQAELLQDLLNNKTVQGPLKTLLDAAQQQSDLIYEDIQQLGDNFFVETCQPWVLPYLADLISLDLLSDDPSNNRRDVARTIAYRRRKGTVPQLETMARDVTGFDCHVVEFFDRMIWSENMVHFRPAIPQDMELKDETVFTRLEQEFAKSFCTVDVRNQQTLPRIDSAFNRALHTADLRPSSQLSGRYNVRKIGFFFWRLRPIRLSLIPAAATSDKPNRSFHFNVLNQPAPLFCSPAPLTRATGADWPRSTDFDVARAIPPFLFAESLATQVLILSATQAANIVTITTQKPHGFQFDQVVNVKNVSVAGYNGVQTVQSVPTLNTLTYTLAQSGLGVGRGGAVSPNLASTPAFAQSEPGFTIYRDRDPVSETIVPADLCAWAEPDPNVIAIDVRLGRILLGTNIKTGKIATDHYFGFSGSIGGGGYERASTLAPEPGQLADRVVVSKTGAVTTISAALATLAGSKQALRIVEINDSEVYNESLALPANFGELVIQAADGCRPVLDLTGQTTFQGPSTGDRLSLRGLLITGTGSTLAFPKGISSVVLDDCIVDPGGGVSADGTNARPAGVTIAVETPGLGCSLRFNRCILGKLDLPPGMNCVAIADSIVDAQQFPGAVILAGGPPATLNRSTLFGNFECQRLDASETIVTGKTKAIHRQEGCVRFSYFGVNPLIADSDSLVPRRYHCAAESPAPIFVSQLFGNPAYAQLSLACDSAIANGDADGGEMGVWSSLSNQRRLAHLQMRLTEYLPAGLTPVIILVS